MIIRVILKKLKNEKDLCKYTRVAEDGALTKSTDVTDTFIDELNKALFNNGGYRYPPQVTTDKDGIKRTRGGGKGKRGRGGPG